MFRLKSRNRHHGFDGSDDELTAEIDHLSSGKRDRNTERRLLRLRHLAGLRRLAADGPAPDYPEPDFERLPGSDTLPEIAREDLTPGLLRAGILRDGCLLVRGLVDREEALRFAAQIDRSFAVREEFIRTGRPDAEGYYEEFEPEPPHQIPADQRGWIRGGGGVLASDSPLLNAEMLELFESAGLQRLVADYLGEPPLISLEKTTLRKAEPTVYGAWHQDGKFMGEVRALNLWLSLSRCGDEAPGLDIVPRRLEEIVASGTEGTFLDIEVSRETAEQAAGDKQVLRPIFEPGDALFFDELFLHATAADPSMPKTRFAIENWFFGASAFPGEYGPLAV